MKLTNKQMSLLNTFIIGLAQRYRLTIDEVRHRDNDLKLFFTTDEEVDQELDRLEEKYNLTNHLAVPFTM